MTRETFRRAESLMTRIIQLECEIDRFEKDKHGSLNQRKPLNTEYIDDALRENFNNILIKHMKIVLNRIEKEFTSLK